MSNRVIPKGAFNPNATTAPGVVVLESLAPGTISGIPTNIVGMVGTATWGPTNARINISTPQDYALNFGSVQTTQYDMGTAVNAAILQGTTGVYSCVRVTDGTDTTATTTLLDTQTVPDIGAYLTALYSGTTGNTIQATVTAASVAGNFNLAIGRPGYPAEIFTNISGSGATFWSNLVTAVNEGQSGVRGPSQLVVASLGTGVNAVTMTSEGTNYSSPPSVSITGGGGSGATGAAILGYAIQTVGVGAPGSYTSVPNISASVGNGATFTAVMHLVSATLVNPGTGYAVNDVLTLLGGTSTQTAQITVNTIGAGGSIATYTISRPGAYTAGLINPFPVSGGAGTGATFNAFWGFTSITVVTGGQDYDSTSAMIFTGGGGTGGATATIGLAATGGVKAVTVTAHGTGYSGTVTVGFTGGGGSGAAGTGLIGSIAAPSTPANPYTFTGGTNGNTGVTGTTLVGADTSPPTGMYVLRNSGMTAFALVDNSTSTTYANQDAFGAVTGSQAILVGPPGQTIAQAVTIKNSTGINQTTSIYMLGDYCYWLDTNNGGITRLISPQGFYAGLLANLSPEQSPLNKQIFGVLATQKTFNKQNYSDADLVTARQSGIEIISNPIPAGALFGCELGVDAGNDISTNPVPIQRMLNFLAYSLSGSGVLGTFIGQLQTPAVQDAARAALNGFLSNLQDNGQIEDYEVILNSTNNPNSRVVLGFMQANVNVQLFSVIYVFLIDLTVGTATLIQS